MTPNTRHHRSKHTGPAPTPVRPTSQGWNDPVDMTMPKRALPTLVTDSPNTAPSWAFAGGLGLSVATILAGSAGGWILLALTLSMGYAGPHPPAFPPGCSGC